MNQRRRRFAGLVVLLMIWVQAASAASLVVPTSVCCGHCDRVDPAAVASSWATEGHACGDVAHDGQPGNAPSCDYCDASCGAPTALFLLSASAPDAIPMMSEAIRYLSRVGPVLPLDRQERPPNKTGCR
jgi:hypothetical protein